MGSTMHKGAILGASALVLTLTACGSDPAPEPVEQIPFTQRCIGARRAGACAGGTTRQRILAIQR